jgi:hypothetical protein
MFQIYADRDETQGVLLCEKHTLGGALCFAADMAEHWDRITIYKADECSSESRVAVISLQGA